MWATLYLIFIFVITTITNTVIITIIIFIAIVIVNTTINYCFFFLIPIYLLIYLFIHFADDTNLLHINDSVKKLNKAVNSDLRNLTNWLNGNKISLNVSKTELMLFKPKMRKLDFDLKLSIYPTKSVKYLGIKIDENLTWIDHINHIVIKLNRANAMLFKVREFVNTKILKSVYYAIFDCHLIYANTVCGQNKNSINRLIILQKKALRIMSFECRNAHSNPLFLE